MNNVAKKLSAAQPQPRVPRNSEALAAGQTPGRRAEFYAVTAGAVEKARQRGGADAALADPDRPRAGFVPDF